MTDVIEHIDAALGMAADIINRIPPDQLSANSLCPGWTVGFELNHLVGGMRISAAELSGVPAERAHHDDWLENDPHAAFATAARLDRAAWHRGDALDTTIQLGFGPVPATTAARIHWTEVLVHGTDLAIATGQTELVDQEQCEQLLATMRTMNFDAFRQPGMFAAERPAPTGAAAHHRLLAFLGRELPLHATGS
ncbi:TIGR03086 family metal-binding protein [Nocardia rhamnosiphila]|uniref:TIGR03086 family metal-binding protein n=1 Tax=Nocardia rhamnosiphila TaxID=426716 RepID=UPI0004C37C6F|nr:TIGR03086 family metal-binding protein [Nocardia rhamnosiphila]